MIQPRSLLLDRLGYTFQDEALLSRALTHRSAGRLHNERLEFLGDSILGFVVAEALYQQQDRAAEGELTRLRAWLVKGDTLAELARGLKLGDFLELGAGELRSGGHARGSILADALEAVFAAIYLDGGLDAVRDVVLQLLDSRLQQLDASPVRKDPKSRLQELLQGQGKALPVYELIEVEGTSPNQRFRVTCRVEAVGLSTPGQGSSRRKAEQAAAELALQSLE